MLYLTPFITIYCCLLAAVFGACVASFTGCVAWRIVRGESVWLGRSHCDACGHVLSARDLVPIASYLLAGGRCRYCGAGLSARYVWGEAVGAAVFVSLLLQYDISLRLLEAWALAAILLACSFADLEGTIIPDRFIAAGVVLFSASLLFSPAPLSRLADGLLGGLCVPLGVLAVVLVMERRMGREAMGGGDLKLLFVTGLFLGWKGNLFCLIAACVFGIVCGLAAARRSGEAGAPIPWGPSIALAAWLTALVGEPLIGWYLSLL